MLPCTTALFSSGVPAWRLLDANLGRSDRVMISEKRPVGSYVRWPCGLGPYISVFWPSFSSVRETSVHVPTRSLAVCATASSFGRINPKISANAVRTVEMMRFIILLLGFGGCSLALAMECSLRVEEHITIPAGRRHQPCSWSDASKIYLPSRSV